jgi:hypothetical protein
MFDDRKAQSNAGVRARRFALIEPFEHARDVLFEDARALVRDGERDQFAFVLEGY